MKKNVMTAIVSGAMVGCLAIGGTFAYLTANSGTVKNTFSGSEALGVLIQETAVDGDTYDIDKTETGWLSSGEAGINYTNVVPGAELAKNVDVKVEKNATASYLFIKITQENEKYSIEDLDSAWKPVAGYDGMYVLTDADGAPVKVDSSTEAQEYGVFTKVKADADVTDVTALNGGNITVTATIVQANGIDYTSEAIPTAAEKLGY